MTAGVAVERGDADQAVDAALALEVSVCEVAFDAEGGALDSGFIAGLHVDDFIFVALALEPAAVHAQENGGPVAGFGSACAGVDEEEAVHAVEFSGEEAEQLHLVDLFFEFYERSVGFGEERLVFRGEFRDCGEILTVLFQCGERFDDVFFGAEFLDGLLGFLFVIPEIRTCHDFFEVLDLLPVVGDLQKFCQISNSF